MMTDEERLLVQRGIASILDMPSVYMGGPSPNSLMKAEAIIKMLERTKRLVPTTCNHSEWISYRESGLCCPRCGTFVPLGTVIFAFRRREGLRLYDVAVKTGVSSAVLSSIEQNRMIPPKGFDERIIEAFSPMPDGFPEALRQAFAVFTGGKK